MVDGGIFRLDETAPAVGPTSVPDPVPPIFNPAPRVAASMLVLAVLLLGLSAVSFLNIALDTKPKAHAVVIGPSAEPGRIAIKVLDGSRPGRWTVPSDEALRPGEEILVRLGGTCRCLPEEVIQPRSDWLPLALFALVSSALLMRGWYKVRRAERALRSSAQLLQPHRPAMPVTLTPIWSRVGKSRARLDLAVDALREHGA